jgi:hypothetical protein
MPGSTKPDMVVLNWPISSPKTNNINDFNLLRFGDCPALIAAERGTLMKRTVANFFGRSALPALALSAMVLFSPVGAMAQRGGGHGGGGHAGGGSFGGGARGFSGGGARSFSGGGFSGGGARGFSGGGGGGRSFEGSRGFVGGGSYGHGYGGYEHGGYEHGGYERGGHYRGGLYFGVGGGYGYGYGYPYGYAYAPDYSYYDPSYYAPSYVAPAPACPPAYDSYGNPIPNSGCYAGQQQYAPQPPQYYPQGQPYGGR